MPGRRAVNLLKGATALAAVLYPVLLLFVALHRVAYPFELEWIEGAVLEHVRRLAAGRTLYAAPSLEFISLPYTPIYYYVGAVVATVVGMSFTALRLVSLVSSLGCGLLVFGIVKKETRTVFPAIAATGLFAATFSLNGWWFDVARVDMLFVVFLLGAIYCLRFHASSAGYLAAGILMALSFLTKQTALLIALPLLLYAAWAQRRCFIALGAALVTTIAASTVLLNQGTGGWYLYYTLTTVSKQLPIDKGMLLVHFWTGQMMRPLAVAILVSVAFLYLELSRGDRRVGWFYLLATSSAVMASAFSLAKRGGWLNTLVPAHAMIAILFGLGIHSLLGLVGEMPTDSRRALECLVYLACIVQFGGLVYNPLSQIPSAGDLRAGKSFLETLGRVKGDVFIPYHPYLLAEVGKSVHAHESLLQDVLTHDDGPVGRGLRSEIETALQRRKFDALVVDDHAPFRENPKGYWKAVDAYYVLNRRLFDDGNVFFPVAGGRNRPELLYVPRKDP